MKQGGKLAIAAALGLGLDLFAFRMLCGAGFDLTASHIASFALAVTAGSLLLSHEIPWSAYPRVLVICLLALFLRGGVLSVATDIWGMSPETAILFAIAAGAVVIGAGVLCVDWQTAALGIVVYALALRLVFLGSLNLLPEEAYYWNYAQHLDTGYLDHPPMVAWLIWCATSLAGNTELGVRLGAYLCWIVAAGFCYGLARDLYGKAAARIATLLFASLPFFFAIGVVMTPDSPLTAAWAGALFFLGRALLKESNAAWWGAGLCLGVGLLSKYTIALLGPAALIFLAIHPRSRAWFLRPTPYLAVVLALLLFSPVILWNAQNDWASFLFQGPRRLGSPFRFSLPELILSAAVLLSPVGLIAAVKALKPQAADPRSLFIAVFTLVPLSVFLTFSLFREIKLDWTGPLWIAVLPAIAAQIAAGLQASALRRVWAPTVATLLVIYGASLHYMVLGLPGLGYGPHFASLPVAWKELGKQASVIEEKLEVVTGEELLQAGMDKYFLSSQLAFYDPDNDGATHTAGRRLVGSDSLMYDYWFPAQRHKGRTVLLFALKSEDLSSAIVASHFESMDAVREEVIYKRSKEAGRLYYRVGYNYRPG